MNLIKLLLPIILITNFLAMGMEKPKIETKKKNIVKRTIKYDKETVIRFLKSNKNDLFAIGTMFGIFTLLISNNDGYPKYFKSKFINDLRQKSFESGLLAGIGGTILTFSAAVYLYLKFGPKKEALDQPDEVGWENID